MHLMVYGEYVQTPQVRFAEKLVFVFCRIQPAIGLLCTNSGAEAVEGALKLAKRFTGRSQIIWHAITHTTAARHGALSVMGNEDFKQAYRPLLPGVNFIRFNHTVDDLASRSPTKQPVLLSRPYRAKRVSVYRM
jgi:acetylornithine/N-succinyldiaminopimelate aminotransferase